MSALRGRSLDSNNLITKSLQSIMFDDFQVLSVCINFWKHRIVQHGLGHEGLQYFSIDKIYRQIHRKCKYCLMPDIQWVNKRTEIILNCFPESLMMFVQNQPDVTESAVMERHTLGSDVRPVSDDTFHYFDWKYKVGRNKFFGNESHHFSSS